MSLSLLKTFSVSKIQNRKACSLLFNSKNLFFNRNISSKNVRNIKTKKEFDDNLFEELYGFKFKKQLNREEIKQKVLEIIKRQPSINEELIKEKGLFARFGSLGINNSKRELFNEICNEFDIQLPLGEYDNIQNGLDICDIVCDLIDAEK